MTRATSLFLKVMKKTMPCLEEEVFVLSIFKLKSDLKCKSIPSKFEWLHKYLCVYWSIWLPVKIIMSL